MRRTFVATALASLVASQALAFSPAELDASSSWNFFPPDSYSMSCTASVGDEDFAFAVSASAPLTAKEGWFVEIMYGGWVDENDWPTVQLRAAGETVTLDGSYDQDDFTIVTWPGDQLEMATILNMLSSGSAVEVIVDGRPIGSYGLNGSGTALQQLVDCSARI